MKKYSLYNNIEDKKSLAANWFKELRNDICIQFESIEIENGSSASFIMNTWNREGGGGGEISIMRGEVFEKVGVNISTVFGEFSEKFAQEIPGAADDRKFWASGISLVAHMNSPFVPAVHMNTRMIVTTCSWFGGGADLTPTFLNEDDTKTFHDSFKKACDTYNIKYYPEFSKYCDEYFFLKHRNEPRGIGGIFYDNLNSGDWDSDFGFTQDVGVALRDVFCKIVRSHMHKKWSIEEKEKQLLKRGRYVEFNLLYDRGTRFGLMTGGNVDAIFMSLPPNVKWI